MDYKKITGEGRIDTGIQVEYFVDMTKNQSFKGKITADLLGYTKASVSVICHDSAVTGSFDIQQANVLGGLSSPLSTPVNIATTPNAEAAAFDMEVTGRYLVAVPNTLVLGSTGNIRIIITAKR